MVPYGLNQEQFVSMYQRKLDGLSDHVIKAIGNLLAQPIGPGVDHAHVEIFLDEYGGAPSIWTYWRGKNNKVDHVDPSLFPGRSLQIDLCLSPLAEIDEQYFAGPDDFPGLQLAASTISRWFAESWWKAGGWSYSVPATLAVHDFGSYGWVQLAKGDT